MGSSFWIVTGHGKLHCALLVHAYRMFCIGACYVGKTFHIESSAPKRGGDAAHELSFLVLSQPARFNAARAHHLKRSIVEQIRELDQVIAPNRPADSVFLTHELFPEQDGAWAITPILGHIRAAMLKSTHRTARWLIVCEEQSHVNVSLLAHHLANEDYREVSERSRCKGKKGCKHPFVPVRELGIHAARL
uniref:Uncharacterized protein n=1 Tax=Anopheles melas TaxID=34690 RepID=A0A182TT33_9DIPT